MSSVVIDRLNHMVITGVLTSLLNFYDRKGNLVVGKDEIIAGVYKAPDIIGVDKDNDYEDKYEIKHDII